MASEFENDGPHDDSNRVTIRTYISHDAAELAAANLEAHGIKCWITSDDGGGVLPYLTAPGGVRLLVRASNAEVAIALLNAPLSPTEINQIETEAVASAPQETVPLQKLAMGQIGFGILSGMVVGVLLCLLYQWSNTLGPQTHYHYAKDGKPDETWIYENEHLAEYKQDRNHDGHWDNWVRYEHGQVVRSEYDNNFDGKPDEIWTYSNGAPATLEKDTDFNGVPDWFGTFKYGILQRADMKPNGSKFAVTREIYQNGILKEIWRGGDGDGHFKEVVRYDPFFNAIRAY